MPKTPDTRKWPCPDCGGDGKVSMNLNDLKVVDYRKQPRFVQRLLFKQGYALVDCRRCRGSGKYRFRPSMIHRSKEPVTETRTGGQHGGEIVKATSDTGRLRRDAEEL